MPQKFPIRFKTILKIEDIKKEKLKCELCNKEIIGGQRFTRLQTYDMIHKPTLLTGFVEELYFHIPCWQEYFSRCVQKRMMLALKQGTGMLKSSPMFKDIIGMIPNIRGDFNGK